MVTRLTRAGWEAATRGPALALDVTVDAAKGLVVVTGHDQLGPDVVGELAEVARRFPSCPAVVIDLEDVDSVDNAAVSGILAMIHRCRERHAMVLLAGASPTVSSAFQAVGAHHYAAMAGSRDEAVQWAGGITTR